MYVAGVGGLKVKGFRRLPAAPTSLTVTKDSSARYFLSFVVDMGPDILPSLETDAGIDLGLSAFAIRHAPHRARRIGLARSQREGAAGACRKAGRARGASVITASPDKRPVFPGRSR
ncbi:hypothetical protein ACIQB5_47905 [Streptomyces sp. NPDC088560]|uniref:hypothetical protein n=1 Tax=Streptomyces sp. NPDC088560 TaxID=3365868 RepID=UPI0038228AFE